MPFEPSVTSACPGPWECTFRYPSALLGKIFERPGPKSVSPARNCPGVAVVVWWRCTVTMLSIVLVRGGDRGPCLALPGYYRPVLVGQHPRQLSSGADAELGEYLAQMPLDRPGTDEELGADLRIRLAIAGQPRDKRLLRGELIRVLVGAPAHLLARRDQLAAGTLGERLHADRGKHVVGGAQVPARVEAPALAAQPLAVQQVGAGQIRAELGPAEPADRLLIEAFGRFALAEQRPAARLDAEGEIVAAGPRRLFKPPERGGRHVGVPGAGSGLDQLGHHQDGDEYLGVPG